MFTTHDIQLLLIDLALILTLARLLGSLARRIGQPPVIGEILGGILLGPTFFHGSLSAYLFPLELKPVLSGIADVGLVLFMFIVGYEIDASLIRGRERAAASISLGSIVVPLASGFGLGFWLAEHNPHKNTASYALFIGASMSVTAFPVLARIITDRGLHCTRIGGLAIASAAVDDIAAWSLLAVVVTVAGVPGTQQWHIALAPAYLIIMIFAVRPLMRRVDARFTRLGRLTPDALAVVLVVLLLSAFATEWMGVHFIFGAFLAGTVMPRAAGQALRLAILERLEQLSVLLLLPVFFVVSGLSVDLSTIGGSRGLELVAILGVAVGGKFIGAYLGARSARVGNRQAGALATLMNTRGLTELVILNVGLQNGLIAPGIFTLLVVMAVVTTVMTGPLLRLIYPPRLVRRDIADAERTAPRDGAGYRVIVVLEPHSQPDADAALVRTAVDLASARTQAEVVLVRLLEQRHPVQRLEVGSGLGGDLLIMTRSMAELHALAEAKRRNQVVTSVYAQFSENIPADLTSYLLGAEPDLAVITPSTHLAAHDLLPRTVVVGRVPEDPPAIVALADHNSDGNATLQVAAALAIGRRLPLVLAGGDGRRERAVGFELKRHGIDVLHVDSDADERTQGLVVGPATAPGTHIVARSRPDEEIDDIDTWTGLATTGTKS